MRTRLWGLHAGGGGCRNRRLWQTMFISCKLSLILLFPFRFADSKKSNAHSYTLLFTILSSPLYIYVRLEGNIVR